MSGDVLPGVGRIRVVNGGRGGRHRRALAKLHTALRARDRGDEHTEVLVTLGRGLADAIDRMEQDGDASEHTLATVAGRYLDVLRELLPPGDPGEADPAEQLAAAARAAIEGSAGAASDVRDPSTS